MCKGSASIVRTDRSMCKLGSTGFVYSRSVPCLLLTRQIHLDRRHIKWGRTAFNDQLDPTPIIRRKCGSTWFDPIYCANSVGILALSPLILSMTAREVR